MITGDFRSAVHAAAAEPWRIDVVVREILAAPDEVGRIMLQYACEALQCVPIGAGDVLTLGEMVEWCWGAKGVCDEVVPGLAWAVVMLPTESPGHWGTVPACLCATDDPSAWLARRLYLPRRGAFAFKLWVSKVQCEIMHDGTRRGDHAAYYNANRRHAKEAA